MPDEQQQPRRRTYSIKKGGTRTTAPQPQKPPKEEVKQHADKP